MMSSSVRAILIVCAAINLPVCGAQDFDQTPVYEALFTQVDRLGLDRTYYVAERPSRLFDVTGFRAPAEVTLHSVQDFGEIHVSIVEESYLAGLWDASCRDGWASFHQRYPDAGDLTRVSQVAFSSSGDQAAVSIRLGRGCLNAWFATYYLEKQEGQWIVTGSMLVGEA